MAQQLKKVLRIAPRTQNDELLYALKIEPTNKQILRRKLAFIFEIIRNDRTREIAEAIGEAINIDMKSKNGDIKQSIYGHSLVAEWIYLLQIDKFDFVKIIEAVKKPLHTNNRYKCYQ